MSKKAVFEIDKIPGTFSFPNFYGNIDVFLKTRNDSLYLTVNGKTYLSPLSSTGYEKTFFLDDTQSKKEDYKSIHAKDILTGSTTISAHLAKDSHTRLTYYEPLVDGYIDSFKEGKISAKTYSMLRYHAQKATKMQLSTIGQKLSEVKPFGKPLAEQKAKAEGVMRGAPLSKNALTTRKITTDAAKVLRGAGITITSISAISSAYNIITSNNKKETFTKEAVGWVGELQAVKQEHTQAAKLGERLELLSGELEQPPAPYLVAL